MAVEVGSLVVRASFGAAPATDGAEARLRAEIARLRRLVRAHENLELLGALEALGGDALARYRAIRRCEDFAPPLAEGAK